MGWVGLEEVWGRERDGVQKTSGVEGKVVHTYIPLILNEKK